MLEALKSLFESSALSEEVQAEIQEALQNTPIVVQVEDIVTGVEDRNNVINAGVLE